MKMLIAGQWLDHEKKIVVKRKFNGDFVDVVPEVSEVDVDRAIENAVIGSEIARKLPVYQRIDILNAVVKQLSERKEEFAKTIATEGVKTIRETRREVLRGINTLAVSAEEARRINGETLAFDSFPGAEKRKGYYYHIPVGIISAIISFNDPLTLAVHKLGPAIAAGNAIILKPSELTPLTALKLAEIFLEAGLPPEILSVLPGKPQKMGEQLISDPRIRMVSFTGGTHTGQQIARKAGLKKIQMELGSNSPVVVMEDADPEQAAKSCVSGAFAAAGQNCIGVQRIYIQNDIFTTFKSLFVEESNRLHTGDNLSEETDMGPVISEKEMNRIENTVSDAISKGATLLSGGKREGNCYLPTVLSDVPAEATITREEIFGPVVCLYAIKTLKEAIAKSNDVSYGLNAAIFTNRIDYAQNAVEEFQAGTVIVNDSTDYRLDMMPFGGVKNSGLGREGIKHAIREMTETKVVCYNHH